MGESKYHKLQKPQDRDPQQPSFWENTAVTGLLYKRPVRPMGRYNHDKEG